MNISRRSVAIAGVAGATALAAVGLSLGGGVNNAVMRAGDGLLNSSTIKWSAVFALIGGLVYLLINKDALKRKVTEYGEISFIVKNGKPRRYKRGRRKGQLIIRRAGQGKNVIPKLRDQVTISWLLEVLNVENQECMYRGRRLGYDLSIEFCLPEGADEATIENLCRVAFNFRDTNRYNELEGTFNAHLKNRVREVIPTLLAQCDPDSEGVPVLKTDRVNWLSLVPLENQITLNWLRVSVLNPRFTSQIEIK